MLFFFFFSSRRRHTRLQGDWSSDVCSSDLRRLHPAERAAAGHPGLAGEREGVASRMSVKRKPAQSKLWAGRFRGKTDPQVDTFTSSLAIDRRLYRHDIAGSIAHCRTLERAGVLTRREADKLVG